MDGLVIMSLTNQIFGSSKNHHLFLIEDLKKVKLKMQSESIVYVIHVPYRRPHFLNWDNYR